MEKLVKILLYAVSFMLLAQGCRIIKPTETFKTDTYKEFYRDTTIFIKGSDVNKGIDSANLALIISKLNKREKVEYRDNNGNVMLSFYLDELGRLQAKCESKDSAYQFQLKEIERKYSEQVFETIVKKQTPVWVWICGGVTLGFLIVVLIKK